MDTPGEYCPTLKVFNMLDAPHGHMRVKLENVRVPKDNIILGPGRGLRNLRPSRAWPDSPLHAFHRLSRKSA
ncbi:MAG: hypothetical protein CM15mP74_24310 [Halieaceae bacterium]|nr:MAG: hypothetical protein CM15mP74_24310 [Halieaceae bacterium]